MKRIFVISFCFVLFLSLIGIALRLTGFDIISINSGGNSNITVSTDVFLEPTIPPIINPPDNGTNGTGGSPPPGGAGGGGAGGGTGGGTIPGSNLVLNPGMFNLTILVNSNLHKSISITNLEQNATTVSVSQTNLTNLLILENSTLDIGPGQTIDMNMIFVAPNSTGIYSGSIIIGNRTVPVILNVVKELLLFDSNIMVLNKNYRVPQGQKLKTQVNMIPMGNNVRLDVTLKYAISNVNGTKYTTSSETVLVTSRQSLLRDFETGNLPIGNYTINLDLVYPYGVAPSSAHFEVVQNKAELLSEIFYWTIIFIVFVSIMIVIIRMLKTLRKLKQELEESQSGVVSDASSY